MNEEIRHKLIKLLPYWHYKVERSIKQNNKKMNITHESYYCLLVLKKEGQMTMSEVANDLYLGKQQATRMVDNLVKNQLVERNISLEDKRVIVVSISEMGKNYLVNNPFDTTDLATRLSREYNAEELIEFNEALNTLLRMLKK